MTDTPTRAEPELGVDRDLAVRLFEAMVLTRDVEEGLYAP